MNNRKSQPPKHFPQPAIRNPQSENLQSFITAGVNLSFNYAAGEAASRFLIALRDEKKILGTRCPSCQRVLVPARSFCPRCFADTHDWVEVGPAGIVSAFASQPPSPSLPPSERTPTGEGRTFALIRLDGADTALVHFIGEADTALVHFIGEADTALVHFIGEADTALVHFIGEADTPRIGLRVVAVFAESRRGHILDIAYFKPA
ncbi:MAG: hypothetical protein HY741_10550 [Chloroflexi bacterium]|nr:hypothetical protein [Chloroflexota bacterium]